jgi:TIR domain
MALLNHRPASNRLRVSPVAPLREASHIGFSAASPQASEIPRRLTLPESRLVLTATRFQIGARTAVLSFPRKREFRSHQTQDARFRGHDTGFGVSPIALTNRMHPANLARRGSAPMSSDSAKPIIFLSYAHLDEPEKLRGEEIQWLTFVMKFLRPAVKSGEFRIWVDRQMQGGTKWDKEIEGHLLACNIFVLLVSANSMGSDYIIDKELEIASRRQTAGELHVYPLLIEPTPKAGLERVRDFNLRPPDAKPASELFAR